MLRMRVRWKINERVSFDALRRDKNLPVFTGQFPMLKHEINYGTFITPFNGFKSS